MIHRRRLSILRAAALSVPLFLATSAHAQFRVGDDGRALDANNRLGSAGYNDNRLPPNAILDANRIITGNVTGGREFRGTPDPDTGLPTSPYRDTREFRGGVAGEGIDRFIRNSSGVPAPYQSGGAPGQSEVFYGRALAAAPPPGFQRNAFTGTFTPGASQASAQQNNVYNPNPLNGPVNNQNLLPKPGALLMPGPVDPQTNRPTATTASSLLGVRRFDLDTLLKLNAPNYNALDQSNQLQAYRLDPLRLEQMRDELRRSVLRDPNASFGGPVNPGPVQNNANPGTDPTNANAAATPGTARNLAQPLPQPFEAPENRPLTARPLTNTLASNEIRHDVRTDQSTGHRLTTPSTAQQSSQANELQRRLQRYYTDRLQTDEQRHAEFRRQLQQRDNTGGGGNSGPRTPPRANPDAPTQGSGATTPQSLSQPLDYVGMSRAVAGITPRGAAPPAAAQQTPAPATQTPAAAPEPLKVKSLAEGIQAAGLAGILATAEDLMRQGKFASAIEQYEAASNVAPSNSMIPLGLAHAEIGAGYYRKAELRLRNVLQADPTLLLGQYDLKAMIGQPRLEVVVRDLKDLANRQNADDGPVFLLAYVAYNTDAANQATVYLTEAEKRATTSTAPTDLYKLLRAHWKLAGGNDGHGAAPASGAAPTEAAASDAAAAIAMPLTEVLQQFEQANVSTATLESDRLAGKFKKPVATGASKDPVTSFRTDLPPGASNGPLGKWLRENTHGADLKTPAAPENK